jgi:uncharacterized protein (TIGR03435 family)
MSSFSGARRALCGAAAFAMVMTSAICGAQSATADAETGGTQTTSPVFDVAVIRPNPGEDTPGSSRSHIWSAPTDGHFKAQNVTALALMQWAFAMSETRIDGGPAWIRAKKFDMEAKPDPAVDEQMHILDSGEVRQRKQRMVQTLLADRFGLKVHRETRILPLYALVVTKGGPKIGTPKLSGTVINTGNSTLTVQGEHSLRMLAEQLSRTLGRVVVDKTGLDGRFELKLKWTQDDGSSPGQSAESAPSLFTALQEQLGLKLEPDKGPVEILVIDHIELPSEN